MLLLCQVIFIGTRSILASSDFWIIFIRKLHDHLILFCFIHCNGVNRFPPIISMLSIAFSTGFVGFNAISGVASKINIKIILIAFVFILKIDKKIWVKKTRWADLWGNNRWRCAMFIDCRVGDN